MYAEDSSVASDQTIAKITDSINSSSMYQPTSSPEDSPDNSVVSVASAPSPTNSPTSEATVFNLESYKRVEDRELPPTPKRVRFEPALLVSPTTDPRQGYKDPENSPRFNHEEAYPQLPKVC